MRRSYLKRDRLRKRPEFLALADKGRRLVSRLFIIVYASGDQLAPRLGITVTKKIGPAVTRNRLKRVCREFFRQHREQLTNAYDIHVIARRAAGQAANDELTKSLEQLFSKIK